MRLRQWKANGWLQTHQTTSSQIAGLLAIVERDLEDSMRNSSISQENPYSFRKIPLSIRMRMGWNGGVSN